LDLYQSGNYIVSKSAKEDANFSLAIEGYQQGYLFIKFFTISTKAFKSNSFNIIIA
jgi:hypothetical protein